MKRGFRYEYIIDNGPADRITVDSKLELIKCILAMRWQMIDQERKDEYGGILKGELFEWLNKELDDDLQNDKMKVVLKIDDEISMSGIEKVVVLGHIRDYMQEKLLNIGDTITFTIGVEEI